MRARGVCPFFSLAKNPPVPRDGSSHGSERNLDRSVQYAPQRQHHTMPLQWCSRCDLWSVSPKLSSLESTPRPLPSKMTCPSSSRFCFSSSFCFCLASCSILILSSLLFLRLSSLCLAVSLGTGSTCRNPSCRSASCGCTACCSTS